MVTVRFYVGEDRTASLVKIYNKIQSNIDTVPSGVTGWVVKPIEIDDVPIVNLDALQRHRHRRRPAARRRRDPEPPAGSARTPRLLRGRRAPPADPRPARPRAPGGARRRRRWRSPARLRGADANLRAGEFARENREFVVDSGPFFESAQELENVVLAAPGRQARVPARRGRGDRRPGGDRRATRVSASARRPGICATRPPLRRRGASRRSHLAFAKKNGTNAVRVAEGLLREGRGARARRDPGRRAGAGHPQLRRDRQREGQRAGQRAGHRRRHHRRAARR